MPGRSPGPGAVDGIAPVDPTRPPTALQRTLHRIGMSDLGRWFGINVSSRADRPLMRLSGGRLATTWFFPLVLLTVPGRRSGGPRTVPLLYFTQGEEVVLTASSFGRRRNPSWYLNVKAHPEVELTQRGRTHRYLAREATGEERDRLFALSKLLYEGYRLYEERATERTIPVLVLRRVGEPAAPAEA
jgi:deazaflavin-dependent oxidoreductase (nitroreductase family)